MMEFNYEQTVTRVCAEIEKNNETMQSFAKKIGVPCVSLRKYLTGKHEFPANLLARIARELNVSSDYLLGLTDYPEAREMMCDSEKKLNEIRKIMNR